MIRWLHISDVHESRNDSYHRRAMYEEIVAAVDARVPKPDLVFLTGDLAFSGGKEQYKSFQDRFFGPLRAVLPDECPVFMVPGNHDVDRNAVVPPRLWIESEKQRTLFQEISEAGRRMRREALLPRFAAYRAFEEDAASWNEDWLGSEEGSILKVETIQGAKIALVGINTAWLCHDDEDWGKLTAGRTMVDAALRQAKDESPDIILVLGHHPLDAMAGEKDWSDGSRIRERLEQANALYLHGHLHTAGHQQTGHSLQTALTIQAPSAFQAGDDPRWRNGIMWGELDLEAGCLIVEPLKWNDDDGEYKFDTDAGKNKDRVQGHDGFRLQLPGRAAAVEPSAAMPSAATAETPIDLPQGWRIIDQAALATINGGAARYPDHGRLLRRQPAELAGRLGRGGSAEADRRRHRGPVSRRP